MKNKNFRFLIVSFTLMFVLCACIFIVLMNRMADRNREATKKIADYYMEIVSSQITSHFKTAIDIKLAQVESIIKTMPPDGELQGQELRESMAISGAARDFKFLGLFAEDGTVEQILGDEVEISDADTFIDALRNGDKRIAMANAPNLEMGLVLLGVPCEYEMMDGRKSMALVGGIDLGFIKDTLSLGNQEEDTYSHIISDNGDFIIKSDTAVQDNFYQRLYEVVPTLNGVSADTYVTGVRNAVDSKTSFTDTLSLGGETKCIYLTPLLYSDWYLITVMSYNTLDHIILQLDHQRLYACVLAMFLMVLIFIIVLAMFYKMTKMQFAEIDKAYNEAKKANKAKSEFLSNMSHDIRTPMNAIVGMTAIATAHIDDRQQLANCLKKITLSSRHLLGLINDILDMSKIESGKMTLNMEPVSLRETMESIVSIIQPQARSKNQRFDIRISNIIAEDVYCDSVRLNQVLINLLSNAYKFTPEDGEILVFVQQEPSPKGERYVRVHFRVKDNGIGMSPEFQERVFESFVREDNARIHKTEGSGLGMAISKYIVDAMGGTIEVASEVNKGTAFHVTLDLEKAARQEEMILPNWNVLLADNEEQSCRDAAARLREMSVNCDWATSGKEAVGMVEERLQKGEGYHFVLLDDKLDQAGGIETAREIHRRWGDEGPVLLIAAYDWSDLEEDAKEAGVGGFMPKPLFQSTLYRGLSQYTGSAQDTQEIPSTDRKDFEGVRVLLAEDNDLNYEIAKELLTGIGMEIEWAKNGQICVDMFQKSPEGYYDVILMDIRMPVMSGYEATTQIRALTRPDAQLPIIAMTADAFSEDVKKCKECGMNDHTPKPIDIEVLSHLISRYLGPKS